VKGRLLNAWFLPAVLAGCAALITQTEIYKEITPRIRSQNWEAAISAVEKARERGAYPGKDELLYLLDIGILHHYAGDYAESNDYLELAERSMEELYTASVSRAALSMLLNDNVLAYRGEDYEDIYLNVFKALNYLALDQYDEALVEIRRLNNKLQLLGDKYGKLAESLNRFEDKHVDFKAAEVDFHNDALGRYLGALLYYYGGQYDDARIDLENYRHAITAQPKIYSHPPIALELSALDTTLLHVVAFVGIAPEKAPVEFRLHTGKNHLLVFPAHQDQSFAQRFDWEGMAEGYYFKFAVPELRRNPSQVAAIEVYANGQYLGALQLLEDLSRVAEVTFQRNQSLIYLKSITRTVLKGLAGKKAKEKFADEEQAEDKKEKKDKKEDKKDEESEEKKSGRGKFAKWLFAAVVDIATEISEQADLRTWRTMPGAAHAGYFPLPEGTYDVSLRFLDAQRRILWRQEFQQVKIARGQVNFLEGVFLR
jgi:hypothetical protein